MLYLETGSVDPAYNLAFEEYVLQNYRQGDILILWQNANSVIVGRNQNAEAEINRAFVEEHGIKVVRRSKGLSHGVNMAWNRKFKLNPGKALAGCMRRNKSLHVFFASGLFDLCTTAGNARYLATHNSLPQDRVMIGEYPSGHMAYLGEESAKLLGDDLRTFIIKSANL